MRRAAITGLAGLSLAGAGLFLARRALLARAFGLRPAEHRVAIERAIPIPMPDGVRLYADRYVPRGTGPFPTILMRSPYGRASEAGPLQPLFDLMNVLFAERGYIVLYQGVRGRFRSEGSFEPMVNEAADGRATLDWIAAQPWFDGNLGMFGSSYLGYTQWAVAADAPPFLKAIVPSITGSRFSQLFYPGGTFALETALRWVQIISAEATPDGKLDLSALASSKAVRRLAGALNHAPIGEADVVLTGRPSTPYQAWMAAGGPDGSYWRSVDHHRALGRVEAAVHLVAAWYDFLLPAQLADYTALLAAGRTPYLTVLPRHHSEPAGQIDAVREGLWWFDAHLKGQRHLLQRRPVRLALMGSREWHEMDFWPPPADVTRFFIHAEGMLSRHTPAAVSPPAHYRFDPRDPTPALGGPVLSPEAGPKDQRPIEARADLLAFTSPPLHEAIDIVGPVRLELYVRSSLAHTDFIGRLCVVEADGRSINLCEGLCRVFPGVGEAQGDGSLRIEVDLSATARRVLPGQRLRLHVCSAAHPRWSVNSGDGRSVAESGSGLQAEQTIYHDTAHPSALVLPLVSARTRARMAGEMEQLATP